MSAVRLSERIVPVDVQTDVDTADDDLGTSWLTPSTWELLREREAPVEVVQDAAVGVAFPEQVEGKEAAQRVAAFLGWHWKHDGDDGPIVSAETVYRRVRVLGCAAPKAPDAKVTTTLELSAAGGGGLELELGGSGLKGSAKYTLTQSLELEAMAGEAKLGYVLVPLTREVRLWRPKGAGEDFEIERFIPIKDISRIGSLATTADVAELLEAAHGGDTTPLGGGNASFSDTRSRKAELSWSLDLGIGNDTSKLGLTASLEGSLEITTALALPAGSFALRWMSGPAGAIVSDG